MLLLTGTQFLRNSLCEVIILVDTGRYALPLQLRMFPEEPSPILALPALTKPRCMLDRAFVPHFSGEETEIRVIKSLAPWSTPGK